MTARNIIKSLKNQKGFTLIELLVVIGILAILLAITLIAINPAKQFNAANDTKRRSDVNEILNAIDQYAVDNHGNLPGGLNNTDCPTATPCDITGPTAGASKIDLCPELVSTYIAALPTDPTRGTDGTTTGAPVSTCPAAAPDYDTFYSVSVGTGGNARVTVTAKDSNNDPISVTR